MPISQLLLLKPLPNRLDDFIARLKTAKDLYEKNGSRVHCFRTVAGSEPTGVLFSSTVEDWGAWAKAAKAVEGNADYRNFQREVANDPAAEVVASAILEEFELPV